MNKTRLEAFTDAILAIIMTIMVLEIHTPKTPDLKGLLDEWVPLVAYLISFLGLVNLWYAHHQVFQKVKVVTRDMFWVNMVLLLWVSLVPVATSWVAEFSDKIFPEFFYMLMEFGWGILLMLMIKVSCKHNPELLKMTHTMKRFYICILMFAVGTLIIPFWPFAGLITGVIVLSYFMIYPLGD